LRDELLNGEVFYTLKEAQVLIEEWRQHYNHVRPHSSLGYRPPAPRAHISHPDKQTQNQRIYIYKNEGNTNQNTNLNLDF